MNGWVNTCRVISFVWIIIFLFDVSWFLESRGTSKVLTFKVKAGVFTARLNWELGTSNCVTATVFYPCPSLFWIIRLTLPPNKENCAHRLQANGSFTDNSGAAGGFAGSPPLPGGQGQVLCKRKGCTPPRNPMATLASSLQPQALLEFKRFWFFLKGRLHGGL